MCPFCCALMVTTLLLTACITDPESDPLLVTPRLPPPTPPPAPPAPTVPPTEAPAVTLPVPSLTPEPDDTGLLWETEQVAQPVLIDDAGERLAVVDTVGRFSWIETRTGQVRGGGLLLENPPGGVLTGDLIAEGSIAVITLTDRGTQTESRLVVVDGSGTIIWQLPPLTGGRTYVAELAPGVVLVGIQPRGSAENALTAYELFTGSALWSVSDDYRPLPPLPPTPAGTGTPTATPFPTPPTAPERAESGFRALAAGESAVYTLIDDGLGGAAAALDLDTETWLWRVPLRSDLRSLRLVDERLYARGPDTIGTLSRLDGQTLWALDLRTDALLVHDGIAAVVPTPTPQRSRPGLLGLDAETGNLVWHSLIGLVVETVAADNELIWAVVKDFDEGLVYLSALDIATGLEQARLPLSGSPAVPYQAVAAGSRVFVIGETVAAFSY
ncbi:MAG: PQQ-binding-like beta-propeller repeat protein [Anaerolineae bacterium]